MLDKSIGFEFKSFAKMNRFHDETMYVTEKIDGTNAQIFIYEVPDVEGTKFEQSKGNLGANEGLLKKEMLIGSRNRYITPEDDNYGFANWVTAHKEDLMKLPCGRHYGEWWGKGIQRGYNAEEKKLSLFNQSLAEIKAVIPCIDFVPVLYQGAFDLQKIDQLMDDLKANGSQASPGFMDVEGVVIYLKKSGIFFKYTYDNRHKWQQIGA